jgi:hypothetical protein
MYHFVSQSRDDSHPGTWLSCQETNREKHPIQSHVGQRISGRAALCQGMVTLTPGTAKVTAGGPYQTGGG